MFIQIIQGRCTREAEMRAALDSWRAMCEPAAEGYLGGTYGFTDDDMFVAVVRFESEQMARSNAERPEQGAWWTQTEKLFDAPPEFHDCRDVMMMLDGGSDEAGFVQIMRGTLTDPERAKAMFSEMESSLHQARPEIMGATLAVEDDGSFMETVAFTSEAAARDGEKQEMPADLRERMESVMTVDQFIDLHRPFFATHA